VFARRLDKRPIGFFTLLAACGANLDAEHGNVTGEHPGDPLADYLAFCSSPVLQKHALGLVRPEGASPFLARLIAFRTLFDRWQSHKATAGNEAARKHEREQVFAFVCQDPASPLGWALLATVSDADAKAHSPAEADAWGMLVASPGLAYTARYEQARCLYHAGRIPDAWQHFTKLYEETAQAGALPTIDADFRAALRPPGDADHFADLLRRTADDWVKHDGRLAVLLLAEQCWQLGDPAQSARLRDVALAGITDDAERLRVTLTAMAFLRQNNQVAPADDLLRPILDTLAFAAEPSLWRLGALLAGQRGQPNRAVECLERAVDLEYGHLPEVVNLQAIRTDYGLLLSHYRAVANALATLHLPPPEEFVARVVRVADRWRALDPDVTAVCQQAADVLQTLRSNELAWDYLTTPLAQKPHEAGPWLTLAQSLQQQGDAELADKALAAAFAAEPTNAQTLWDRAQLLRRCGRSAEARALFKQLAEGTWQPRFAWLQGEAKRQLGQ
jgi:tetratricopeptide (TPR) repeat protein